MISVHPSISYESCSLSPSTYPPIEHVLWETGVPLFGVAEAEMVFEMGIEEAAEVLG